MTLAPVYGTVVHLAFLLGPAAITCLVLHQLNVLTTRVMAESFGPWSVIWATGWLGTPIHELSHAVACVVFGHQIQEIVLFRPDPATGVVGYVRHAWSPRNPWALLGQGFIGIAPLFGGAAVLAGLQAVLLPEAAVVDPFGGTASWSRWVGIWGDRAVWAEPVTWLFGYLVLCVGTHLAPSGPDLKNAWPSLALVVFLLGGVDLALMSGWPELGSSWRSVASAALGPVVALLAFAAGLVAAAFVVVLALATVVSGLTGTVLRPVRSTFREPWRVGLVAAAAAWVAWGAVLTG